MTDPNKDPAQDKAASDSGDIDWAAALSEQAAHTASSSTQADGLAQEVDDWASALAEQTATQNAARGAGISAYETGFTGSARGNA